MFSTGIANEPSEPTSTKLDFLDRHRKRALGARFRNETRKSDEASFSRQASQMSPRSQVQKRDQKHRRSLIFSTIIANGSSEPGSKTRLVTRPETSTKLDLIDRCRKRELGARCRIETRNETRDIHEARSDRQVSQTGARSHVQRRDQKRDQGHPRSSI